MPRPSDGRAGVECCEGERPGTLAALADANCVRTMPSRHRKLTEDGPVARQMFWMALPMVGGLLATMTFHLVDTYFVSRLGTDPLAAIGFASPVVMLVFSFAIGIGSGASSAVSRALGRDDEGQAARLSTDALALAAGVGALVTAAGLALYEPIFALLGAREHAMPYVHRYMFWWWLGVVPLMVMMVGNTCLQASGDTLRSGLILAGAAGVNAVLDPILIFGLGPVPAMGIAGAAVATFLARLVAAGTVVWMLGGRKGLLTATWPGAGDLARSWWEVLHVGIPSSATTLLFPLSMGVVTRLTASFGAEAVAAAGAGQQGERMLMVAFWSTSWVVMPFAGQNWGAGRTDRVRRVARTATAFSLLYGAACLLAALPTAGLLAGAIGQTPRVERIMTWYLWIAAAGVGFRGATVLGCAFFNGIDRPLVAGGIDVVRMFVLTIPLAALGSRLWGVAGIFAGVSTASVLSGTLAMAWMHLASRGCPETASRRANEPDRSAAKPPAALPGSPPALDGTGWATGPGGPDGRS